MLKKYDTKFEFCLSKEIKKKILQRSNDLDLSMADYVRTLIKRDLTLIDSANNEIREKANDDYIEKLNKKLLGFFKGV